jgi:hypothetical protein
MSPKINYGLQKMMNRPLGQRGERGEIGGTVGNWADRSNSAASSQLPYKTDCHNLKHKHD